MARPEQNRPCATDSNPSINLLAERPGAYLTHSIAANGDSDLVRMVEQTFFAALYGARSDDRIERIEQEARFLAQAIEQLGTIDFIHGEDIEFLTELLDEYKVKKIIPLQSSRRPANKLFSSHADIIEKKFVAAATLLIDGVEDLIDKLHGDLAQPRETPARIHMDLDSVQEPLEMLRHIKPPRKAVPSLERPIVRAS